MNESTATTAFILAMCANFFLASYPGWGWVNRFILRLYRYELYFSLAQRAYNTIGMTWQEWLVFMSFVGFPLMTASFRTYIHYADIPYEWGQPAYLLYDKNHWVWHWHTVGERDVVDKDGNKTGERVMLYGF